jgi:hypothetical protein
MSRHGSVATRFKGRPDLPQPPGRPFAQPFCGMPGRLADPHAEPGEPPADRESEAVLETPQGRRHRQRWASGSAPRPSPLQASIAGTDPPQISAPMEPRRHPTNTCQKSGLSRRVARHAPGRSCPPYCRRALSRSTANCCWWLHNHCLALSVSRQMLWTVSQNFAE